MITIDEESKNRILSSFNFDYMTDRYNAKESSYIIPSPEIAAIEQNFYYLLKHSEVKPFQRKYIMKPSYLSYDEYGTVMLSSLLMFINNVKSIEDFHLDRVVIPTFDAIINICKNRFPDRDVNELLKINW